ncbi:hypothetical protein ANO14919_106480 [Xylariales sp. No.14919]|nr:hypothetical protein ANO14919_106480 [Xylariales sp. No.14919]
MLLAAPRRLAAKQTARLILQPHRSNIHTPFFLSYDYLCMLSAVCCWQILPDILGSQMGRFLYLSLAAALPSNQARQDVGIQSVNLVFNADCKRQSEIEDAWDDAIKLMKSLPKVDFNDVAAVDFLDHQH